MKPFHIKPLSVAIIALLAISSSPILATSLIDVWREAQNRDPEFIASRYEQMAGEKRRDQGTSLWLPSINLTALTGSMSYNTTTTGAQFYAPGMGTFNGANFNTSVNNGFVNRYTVGATQSIYNRERLSQSRQLNLSADASNLGAYIANQNLILLVAERYFDVLSAEEAVRLIKKQEAAITNTRQQIEKRFKLGDASQTDMQEANERLDSVKVRVLDATTNLTVKKLALQDLFGGPVNVDKLKISLNSSQLTLPSIDTYIAKLKSQNIQLQMLSIQEKVAKEEAEKYGAITSPKLDAVAQSSKDNLSGSGNFGPASNTATNNYLVGLQLSIPLYTGGYRTAKQEESLLLIEKTKAEYSKSEQNLERTLRSVWYSLNSAKDKLNALSTAQKTGEARLKSTRVGYSNGSRTTMELLGAESDLIANDYALYMEKVNYLLNRLRLAALIGEISEQDLSLVNAYLN
ncbi:TolC family protein [Polynucleobacter sp. MWH-UH25E]|uniref:TolC family protein n=1 Tax=Polynucleobacter sp. MWH-UH25E TaxID=1855616 RepID=UPI001BFDF30B|nr:TolC family protein [Polynucleobacter sp. MWH-UH25E]QWD62024.1 TolC family protein [Polynucleobacter sp. MWH-UH25E]